MVRGGVAMGVAPVVKHGFPKCHMREVIEAVDFARTQLSKRRLAEAHASLQEALVFLYQAVGVMHEYVAVCCTLMAKVYNTSAAASDEKNAMDSLRMAIMFGAPPENDLNFDENSGLKANESPSTISFPFDCLVLQ